MNESTATLKTTYPAVSFLPKSPFDPNFGVSDSIILLIIAICLLSIMWALWCFLARYGKIRRCQKCWNSIAKSERLYINEPVFRNFQSHCVQIDTPAGVIWKRCVDASEVFNDQEFGADLDQYRFLTTMPAVLTGIGIFGTFIGLQSGLQNLQFDPPEMLDLSIRQLVGGVAVAFSTSLWGIGASIFLGLIEKLLDQQSKNQLREFQRQVDKEIPKYAPEDALRDVADNTKAAKITLEGLATQIGDRIQQGITQAITQSIDDSLRRLTEKFAESLREGMQQGQDSRLQRMLDEMSNGLKREIDRLTTEVASVGGRLSDPLIHVTARISESMDQFAETTGRVGQVMEGAAAQMDQGLQVILTQSNIAERLLQTADRFAGASESLDPFRESLIVAAGRNLEAAESQKLASSAQQAFLQSLTGATEKLGDLRATYESAAMALRGIADPIQRLAGLVESLIANSEAGQKANEAAWNKATAALASSGEYVEAMAAASKEIQQAALRFETLRMTLSTAGAQAATATVQIQNATEANERIAASLTALSRQLPALAKGMEHTRKETDKAQQDVGALRDLISGINSMLAKMERERDQEEAERLAGLTQLINDAAGRMQQAAQALAVVDSLGKVLQHTVDAFNGASENLQTYGTDVKQSANAHRESAKHSLDAVQEYRELMDLLTGLPDSIAEASGTLHSAGEEIRKASAETQTTMQAVLEGQNKWLAGTQHGLRVMRDQLNSIMQRYGEATQGQTKALMEEWKRAVSEALQSYGERVEEIRELVENLQEQLDQQNEV